MNTLYSAAGEFYCNGTDSARATRSPWQATGYEKAFPAAEPGEFSYTAIQYLDGHSEPVSVFRQPSAESLVKLHGT